MGRCAEGALGLPAPLLCQLASETIPFPMASDAATSRPDEEPVREDDDAVETSVASQGKFCVKSRSILGQRGVIAWAKAVRLSFSRGRTTMHYDRWATELSGHG